MELRNLNYKNIRFPHNDTWTLVCTSSSMYVRTLLYLHDDGQAVINYSFDFVFNDIKSVPFSSHKAMSFNQS